MKLFDKLLKGRQVDKSINKEEIQAAYNSCKRRNSRKKKNNLQEYGMQGDCCMNY